jgi:hypothetical protein
MFDRIPVNGIAVPFEILVVAHPMFPVSVLPEAALAP